MTLLPEPVDVVEQVSRIPPANDNSDPVRLAHVYYYVYEPDLLVESRNFTGGSSVMRMVNLSVYKLFGLGVAGQFIQGSVCTDAHC